MPGKHKRPCFSSYYRECFIIIIGLLDELNYMYVTQSMNKYILILHYTQGTMYMSMSPILSIAQTLTKYGAKSEEA